MYFSFSTEYRCEPFITQANSQVCAVRSTIAPFRTGCYDWLQVGMARHRPVDHEEQRCPSCPDCVEDGMHAIFHCQYTLQRLMYEDLSKQPECLRSFLINNPPHTSRVAQFLKAYRNVRSNGQRSLSHNCTICYELANNYESD